MVDFTEEQALKMEKATDHFLIKLEDNIYGIRFNGFKLKDVQTGKIYHEYYPKDPYELDYFADHMLDYPFPNDILKGQKHLGTSLKLVVGDKFVKNVVLLERHYIGGKLAANFRFVFPAFIPKSSNDVEFIYEIPKLTPEVEEKLKKGEDVHAESDTFVFVDGKLNVHRRAKYTYYEAENNEEEKKEE